MTDRRKHRIRRMRRACVGALLAVLGAPLTHAEAADPAYDPAFPPALEELAIPSAGARMGGLVYTAAGAGPHPTFVMLHGFPGNEKNIDLAQALRRAGFNVVYFHFRGAWGSEGEYRIMNLEADVAAVLSFLRDTENAARYRVDPSRLSLLGHSMGGFAALAAGRSDPQLVCVGAMAPANVALIAERLHAGDAAADAFMAYTDGLFMLAGYDGETVREELLSAAPERLDTRTFGAALRGRSVFMINGDRDASTPAAETFLPVVRAYEDVDGLRLTWHVVSGDHSFSWGRQHLAKRVLDWARSDCR
jgi:pimeloyl-ACP methyl ester carboxylesterase